MQTSTFWRHTKMERYLWSTLSPKAVSDKRFKEEEPMLLVWA